MIFSEMNSRAQVDLIDLQTQPDGDLKWILVYQNHLTKFVQLRPVKSKRAPEIAYQMLDFSAYLELLVFYKVMVAEDLWTLLLPNSAKFGLVWN